MSHGVVWNTYTKLQHTASQKEMEQIPFKPRDHWQHKNVKYVTV